MEQNEILEGNLIIAAFDGWKFFDDDTEQYPNGYYILEDEDSKSWSAPDTFSYHDSWDWLMPCVEKINGICHVNGMELSNHSADQKYLENPLDNPLHWKSWSYHAIVLSTDINRVWSKAVEFIKWLNSQSTVK